MAKEITMHVFEEKFNVLFKINVKYLPIQN